MNQELTVAMSDLLLAYYEELTQENPIFVTYAINVYQYFAWGNNVLRNDRTGISGKSAARIYTRIAQLFEMGI